MPEVRTTTGRVRGTTDAGIAVFRGIPFAQPPVGALRFAEPEPARKWDGVREAVAYGPPPPQAGVFGMDDLARDAGADWLTVNVWSPEPRAGADLPVMVWIQGGAYTIGMASLPEYDGARLARHGVVVVTFNYRVGIEGFAHVEGAPANRGLLDQVAALEWVREDVRAFGGDPDRVTVFGQSAGGGSVAALFAVPRATGLFRRAIAQSSQGTYFTPELAADIAAACAAELGLRPTAGDLATTDPARLPAAGDAVMAGMSRRADRWGRAAHRSILFSPVIDGEVMTSTPWEALAGGTDIDLLAGHTRDEQRLLTALDGLLGQVTESHAATALEVFAPDGPDRFRAAYPDASPEELYEAVHSDWLFRMPTHHLALAHGRAHLYELTWPAPGMGGVLGACHGLDVPLVFGNLTSGQPAALIGESEEAEELSRAMRTAWTAFAAHDDPGWPVYDTTRHLTRLFDTEPTVAAYPEARSREVWRDHAFPALPLIKS
ncbi:Carboxylesterase [Actinosynnema sp. ALI-1.44]